MAGDGGRVPDVSEQRAETPEPPQGEGHEKCGHGACVRPKGHTGSHSVHLEGTPFSVPQGEDHEAGIEAAAQALIRLHSVFEPSDNNFAWVVSRHAVAAYRSRVSPSRDGTVAVEDVVRWLKVRQGTWSVLVKDFEREFGSARAGESNEGGNQ
jgi:hypothetical protein